MNDDERQIRALIERWAKAVQAINLDGVLADHADDIVMFDVPPPNEVRGKEAYRETWPPFFNWLRQGAVFEIVSLDVTAGPDVAFAHALLRCGTDEEFKKIPTTAFASPSGSASRVAAGQLRTSITRSQRNHRRQGGVENSDRATYPSERTCNGQEHDLPMV